MKFSKTSFIVIDGFCEMKNQSRLSLGLALMKSINVIIVVGCDWIKISNLHDNAKIDLMRLILHIMDEYWKGLSQNPRITIEFVLQNLKQPWNWYYVSANPSITWDDVQKYPKLPWDLAGLSLNVNITQEIIAANLDLHWNWNFLIQNPLITKEFILKHRDKVNSLQLMTKFVDWHEIEDDPDGPWDWSIMHRRDDFDWEMVLKLADRPWDWKRLQDRNGFSLDLVRQLPDKPWNWESLYIEKDFSIILELPDKPWDWSYLSRRDGIMDVVLRIPDKPWNWHELTWYATDAIVRQLPDKPWNWRSVSRMVKKDFVLQYPDKDWNWYYLSSRHDFTEEVALTLPDKLWDWEEIMSHSGAEITSISHARDLRDEGYKPKQIRDNALYKTVLGLPLDKPICYMPILLWLKVPIFPDKCDENPSLARLMRILRALPPELQEPICAWTFGIPRITAENLKCLQN